MSRTAAVSVDDPDQKGLGARKSIVPYGLYRVHGYISAHLSSQTNFSEDDLEILWSALMNMFDQDPAAARTGMHAQKLIIFKHVGTDSDPKQRQEQARLGCARAQELLDLVKVEESKDRKSREDRDAPPRVFTDYIVTPIDEIKAATPKGVKAIEML